MTYAQVPAVVFVKYTDAPTLKALMSFSPAGYGECMWASSIVETLDGWFVTYFVSKFAE